MRTDIWNPKNPITHTLARPPEAELQSVKDQIRLADNRGYKGTLHIAHLSVPEAYLEIEKARSLVDFNLSCEVAPHHVIFYDEFMNGDRGLLFKMNPPLRTKEMQEKMMSLLLGGKIDYIGTDHAPHTLDEKMCENAASGIPGLTYFPIFLDTLRSSGFSENQISLHTHDNIVKTFNIPEGVIANTNRGLGLSKIKLEELSKEYESVPLEMLPR